MIFEHIGPDGECKMQTTDPGCISMQVVEDTASLGYRFKIDGKFVAKSNIVSEIKSLQRHSTTVKRTCAAPSEYTTKSQVNVLQNDTPASSNNKRVSFKDLINKVG